MDFAAGTDGRVHRNPTTPADLKRGPKQGATNQGGVKRFICKNREKLPPARNLPRPDPPIVDGPSSGFLRKHRSRRSDAAAWATCPPQGGGYQHPVSCVPTDKQQVQCGPRGLDREAMLPEPKAAWAPLSGRPRDVCRLVSSPSLERQKRESSQISGDGDEPRGPQRPQAPSHPERGRRRSSRPSPRRTRRPACGRARSRPSASRRSRSGSGRPRS